MKLTKALLCCHALFRQSTIFGWNKLVIHRLRRGVRTSENSGETACGAGIFSHQTLELFSLNIMTRGIQMSDLNTISGNQTTIFFKQFVTIFVDIPMLLFLFNSSPLHVVVYLYFSITDFIFLTVCKVYPILSGGILCCSQKFQISKTPNHNWETHGKVFCDSAACNYSMNDMILTLTSNIQTEASTQLMLYADLQLSTSLPWYKKLSNEKG